MFVSCVPCMDLLSASPVILHWRALRQRKTATGAKTTGMVVMKTVPTMEISKNDVANAQNSELLE